LLHSQYSGTILHCSQKLFFSPFASFPILYCSKPTLAFGSASRTHINAVAYWYYINIHFNPVGYKIPVLPGGVPGFRHLIAHITNKRPFIYNLLFTLPDNYEISIGWFIGLGFISVIFGFIYYFKYLKELFLALIDPRTKTYSINGGGDDDGSDVNFYIPQRHVNTVMEPIAPFLSDSDTKILFALSKYANKFMEIVK